MNEKPGRLAEIFTAKKKEIITLGITIVICISLIILKLTGGIESLELNGFAQISIIDSGIGLSAESMDKLFKYDQHFMNKGTAGETGTGLGLILCKDFIDKNGGTIRVESELKKGSTFVFTLPLAEAPVSAHPQGV